MSISADEMRAGQAMATMIDELAESMRRVSGVEPSEIVVASLETLRPLADFLLVRPSSIKGMCYHGMMVRVDPIAPPDTLYLLPRQTLPVR